MFLRIVDRMRVEVLKLFEVFEVPETLLTEFRQPVGCYGVLFKSKGGQAGRCPLPAPGLPHSTL